MKSNLQRIERKMKSIGNTPHPSPLPQGERGQIFASAHHVQGERGQTFASAHHVQGERGQTFASAHYAQGGRGFKFASLKVFVRRSRMLALRKIVDWHGQSLKKGVARLHGQSPLPLWERARVRGLK